MPCSIDRPQAGLDRACGALGRLHMACDLQAALRRLGDEQTHLVDGVAPRFAVDADLDDLRSEQHDLAHRLHDLVGRVGIEVFRIDDVVLLDHLGRGPELAAHAADDQAGIDDGRTGDPALVDRDPMGGVRV